jgi:Tol biopolymer transport system component
MVITIIQATEPAVTGAPSPIHTPNPTDTPTSTPEIAFTSMSPDGRWLARGAEETATDAGDRHAWLDVSKTDGSVAWRVVDERSGQALGQTTPKPFGWSQDGRYLYFTNYGVPDGCPGFVNGSDLQRVDLLQGSVTEILPGVGFWLALSPDESRLAYIGYRQRGLIVRDLATGEEREIGLDNNVESARLGHILWSPGGTQLVLTAGFNLCGPPEERAHSIIRVALSDGEHTTLIEPDRRLFVTQAWQTPGRVLLTDQDGRRWEMDVDTGDVDQLQ